MYVELYRIETGLEDDELVPTLGDAALGEPDECGANALACSRRPNVKPFDRVGSSMKPADNQRAMRSKPHLILRYGPLHAWNAAAFCPVRRLALGHMGEGELADSRSPNAMKGRDIDGIGESIVQRLKHEVTHLRKNETSAPTGKAYMAMKRIMGH